MLIVSKVQINPAPDFGGVVLFTLVKGKPVFWGMTFDGSIVDIRWMGPDTTFVLQGLTL